MTNIKLYDKGVDIANKTIKHIEGGFGENSMCVTVDDVASVHCMTVKALNESVRKLIKKNFLIENEDYIDLFKIDIELARTILDINKSNRRIDLFLFSERGYTKLVTTLKNSKKKLELVEELVENYFNMKEQINNLATVDFNTYLDTLPKHMSPTSLRRYIKSTINPNNIQDIVPKLLKVLQSIDLNCCSDHTAVTSSDKIKCLTSAINAIDEIKNEKDLKIYDICKIDDYNNQLKDYRHKVTFTSNNAMKRVNNDLKKELKSTKEELEKIIDEKSIIEKPIVNEENKYEDLLRSFKVYRNYLAKVWDMGMEEVCNDYYDLIPVKLPMATECQKLGYKSKFEYCYAYYPDDTKIMVNKMYRDCVANGYLERKK